MEPTPTGESAHEDGADREDGGGEDAAPGLPAPRRATPALPRRARTEGASPTAREPEPRTSAGQDPDGRPYGAADDETLHRLLSGLRDI